VHGTRSAKARRLAVLTCSLMQGEEPRLRAASGSKRLALPPFVGFGLGAVAGVLIEAANHQSGMLSELNYLINGGLGAVVGFGLGVFLGVFLYVTRPR
jgi:hypothetical protein